MVNWFEHVGGGEGGLHREGSGLYRGRVGRGPAQRTSPFFNRVTDRRDSVVVIPHKKKRTKQTMNTNESTHSLRCIHTTRLRLRQIVTIGRFSYTSRKQFLRDVCREN